MSVTRRRFLLGSSALGVLLALPLGCGRQEGDGRRELQDEGAPSLDALALALRGFDAGQLSDPRDVDALRGELNKAISDARDAGEPAQDTLRRLIERDHARGDTVDVQGWQLAHHEHLLLLLASALGVGSGQAPPGETAMLRAAQVDDLAVVEAWGPSATCAGVGFNTQDDGHSSLWVALAEGPFSGLKVVIGGMVVPTTHAGAVLTTRLEGAVFAQLFGAPGELQVELYDDHDQRRQVLGQFTVREAGAFATLADGSTSRVWRAVEGWGPTETGVLAPFNLQADGNSTFWIKTSCAPSDTQVWLGDVRLDAIVAGDVITAGLAGLEALADPGILPLRLVHPPSGEELVVGQFHIRS